MAYTVEPWANTLWLPCNTAITYVAYYIVRPEGYSGPSTIQLLSSTTKTTTVSGTWSYKCPTTSFLSDLWADRQLSTTNWLANINNFADYENLPLCPGASLASYLLYYGTGTTAWTTAQIGSRYPCCARLGFKPDWANGFYPYYTEEPLPGYTWTVGTSSPAVIFTNTVPGVSCTLQYLYVAVGYSTNADTTLITLKTQPTTVGVGTSISVPMTRVNTSADNVRYVRVFVSGYFNGQPTNYYRLKATMGPHNIVSNSYTNAASFGMNEFTEATMDFTLGSSNIYVQFAGS